MIFIFSNRVSPISNLNVEPHEKVFIDCPLTRDGIPVDLIDYQIIHSWHAFKGDDCDLSEIIPSPFCMEYGSFFGLVHLCSTFHVGSTKPVPVVCLWIYALTVVVNLT